MDCDSNFRMSIGGRLVLADRSIDVVDPATGESFARAPAASLADLDDAIAAANAAFPAWRARPISERKALLAAASKAMLALADDLAPTFTREQGRPLAASKMEIGGGAYWLRDLSRRDLPVEVIHDDDTRRVEVRREPLGAIGAIAPWNSPVLLAIWKLGPALLAGNTVVLKPSPYTPLCALKLGEAFNTIFPPGVVNVISGDEDLGPRLTAHSGLAKISFTGSSATGRRVFAGAAPTLKKLTLELGGNDAGIVMPDVNINAVADKIFASAFLNSAQVCIATKRLYVHDDIYDAVLDRLFAIALRTPMGNGLDPETVLGPLQNAAQQRRVLDLIEAARAAGCRVLQAPCPQSGGFFVPVTLVDDPPEESRVVVEEAFGPVLPVLRFSHVDDVVERANASDYGLGATIWSRDLDAAQAIAGRLDTGSVWINSTPIPIPTAPFAGRKQSGVGVENGQDGVLAFTQPKTIHLARA